MDAEERKTRELVEVKKLRVETGWGLMDCKRALIVSGWNVDKAKKWLENRKNYIR